MRRNFAAVAASKRCRSADGFGEGWKRKNPYHHPGTELEATWDQSIRIYVTSGTLNHQRTGVKGQENWTPFLKGKTAAGQAA